MIRLSLCLLAALAVSALQAASTQVWEVGEQDAFLRGRFESVSLDPEGLLRLAPAVSDLFDAEDAVLWTAAAAPNGKIYAAGGHQGRLYEIDSNGKSELLWDAPEIEIFALALAPGGEIYAATSPNGKIYRVRPNGEADELFDPKQTYIWSLAADRDAIYAGTGDGGRIFRISPSGDGEEYFNSGQRHVVSLAFDNQGRLLAGTDPNGILYRIDGPANAFALYDSDLPEVRSLAVDPSGDIFFAALGGAISLSEQTIQAVSAATISVTASAQASSSTAVVTPATPSTAVSSPSVAVSQPPISYGIETSAVFRLQPGLAVHKLWSSKQENVIALARDPASPGKLLFATDQSGRLYQLDSQGDASLVTQQSAGQITAILPLADGALLTAAHPGALRRLKTSLASSGLYFSGVHDAGGIAQWGRLSPEAEGQIEFRTRSGNSARPDAAWSDWSDPIPGPDGGLVTSPSARYLQWQARLTRAAVGPVLEHVRVSYLPENRPPEISAVNVEFTSASDDSSAAGADSSSSSSSSDADASYSITVSAGGPSPSTTSSSQQQTLAASGRRRMKISWTASDPDSDELRATVEFRGQDESSWKSIKSDISQSHLSIDSDALADGRYRFRVQVSDALSNPSDWVKTASRISRPVLIDHTAPSIRLVSLDAATSAHFEALDQASMVERAEYSVDAGPWRPLRSDDGIADSQLESFTVPLTDLDPGERLITLRIHDHAGNTALAKAIVNNSQP